MPAARNAIKVENPNPGNPSCVRSTGKNKRTMLSRSGYKLAIATSCN